jgi:hypothetical protein
VTSLGNPKIITLLWFGDRSKHLLRIFSCDISLQATAIDLRRQGSAADAYQAFGPAIEPIQKRITEARSRCSHRRLVATDRAHWCRAWVGVSSCYCTTTVFCCRALRRAANDADQSGPRLPAPGYRRSLVGLRPLLDWRATTRKAKPTHPARDWLLHGQTETRHSLQSGAACSGTDKTT